MSLDDKLQRRKTKKVQGRREFQLTKKKNETKSLRIVFVRIWCGTALALIFASDMFRIVCDKTSNGFKKCLYLYKIANHMSICSHRLRSHLIVLLPSSATRFVAFSSFLGFSLYASLSIRKRLAHFLSKSVCFRSSDQMNMENVRATICQIVCAMQPS